MHLFFENYWKISIITWKFGFLMLLFLSKHLEYIFYISVFFNKQNFSQMVSKIIFWEC